MTNGKNYTEVRIFQRPNFMLCFYFITRCYSSYFETVLADLCQPPYPDIIIMNSCLWDITRLAPRSRLDVDIRIYYATVIIMVSVIVYKWLK